jgi:hypothetical protein
MRGVAGLASFAFGIVLFAEAAGCGSSSQGGPSTPPSPFGIVISAGDYQTAPAGTALVTSLVVTATYKGAPAPGNAIVFSVEQGGGSVASPDGFTGPVEVAHPLGPVSGRTISVTTDSQGQARVTWTLGPQAGLNTVLAGYPTIDTPVPTVTFQATGN